MTNAEVVTSHILEMRELKADDLFKMMPIIGKLDIKDVVVNMFQGGLVDKDDEEEQDEELVGMEIVATLIQTLMTNIPLVKDELNSLLGDLTGKTEKEIGDLDFGTYTKLIVDFFKKPELGDFFKSIASLMG
ncbi:hypothetical protein WS105_0611 [Weissella ceti]|uniref:hypothetical protein n=1 Tax=Weissella ceti TaxID=759620 RepID=UPI0004F68DB9|nr:hypothetical protein [Weissella ceti]AIM64201.1 hypothetical protein WS105_0611 [Weissella ceti]